MSWDYRTPVWLSNRHAQTIYPALAGPLMYPKKNLWLRERVTTQDHDFVELDWGAKTGEAKFLCVLFHGLEGNSSSHYCRAFAHHIEKASGAICIVHFRGCGGEINLAPRAYHSGDYEEIDWVLQHIKKSYAGPIWCVGVSLGGNALLRWAQESGECASQKISGLAAICAPMNLRRSGIQIGRGINHYLYELRFLRTMKQKARAKYIQYPGLFNLERALNANSLYDFDDCFTAPLHGFLGVEDYWSKCASDTKMKQIKINSLIINALNDPFIPADSLPVFSAYNSSAVVCYTQQGGHVGYAQSSCQAPLGALPQCVLQWMNS